MTQSRRSRIEAPDLEKGVKAKMARTTIRKIEKQDIPACTRILRNLAQWFGIEQAILNYEQSLTDLDGYIAEIDSSVVGFVGLKRYGAYSIEINVIAVQPLVRHSGIGKALLEYVEAKATTPSTKLLHTKTIAPSSPDENYAETRLFWEAVGFSPMDELELWAEHNPCQVMVKPIGKTGERPHLAETSRSANIVSGDS